MNTHLFYHPAAGFIRLLQVDAMVQLLSSLREVIRLQGIDFTFECDVEEDFQPCNNAGIPFSNEIVISTMLIGDLNSTQKTAAIDYLLTGAISSSHEVWQTINNFKWGKRQDEQGEEEDNETNKNDDSGNAEILKCDEVDMPSLVHNFKFTSAAGFPQFTNYTKDFKDLLDYIFIDENIDVARILPFPTEDQLSVDVALPSSCYPSDHISVVVDLKFKLTKF